MNPEARLSAVVLTKNSSALLEKCLQSLKFADELIIIDDFSTDETADIASRCGAKVIRHAMDGDFAAQRRFGIAQCNGDWVLFIDSDEFVTDELAEDIRRALSCGEKAAYFLKRENRFPHYDIAHGSMRSDRVLRLFPKEGLEVEGRVHEKLVSPFAQKNLQGVLLHQPYDNWSATIRKLDVYTDYLAVQQVEKGRKTGFFAGVFIKPIWAFIKVYFFNKGFLDGRMGVMFAVHHAYYTFMKYAKYFLLVNSGGKF